MIFASLQWLLPHHAISRVVHWLARLRQPWFHQRAISAFVRYFDVDLAEASRPDIADYASFNDFFTRSLKPGARPADPAADAVLCPVDGTVSQRGEIRDGRLLQAKGRSFGLVDLLGGDTDLAPALSRGVFATLYLAPYNYHRIHMPLDGTPTSMRLVPGRLFSVNAATARSVDNLFARNERVVCRFETAAGPLAMVLVGAMNVGSIETVWAGEVTPGSGRRPQVWTYQGAPGDPMPLAKGQEMGRFNMGSTVIVLLPHGAATLDPAIVPGATVRLGQRLATLSSTGR